MQQTIHQKNKSKLFGLLIVLSIGLATTASVIAADANGKSVYDSTCVMCHKNGVMGAPKLGDAADWKQRLAQGKAALYEHAVKGYKGKKGFMPAKGGNAKLSDNDVKAAVDYFLTNSK